VDKVNEFTLSELQFLKTISTPQKIQDFLDNVSTNWEPEGDTVISPLRVLREKRAHCIEAAMFAAMVLRMHGYKPLLVDLTANKKDQDHVLAVFKKNNHWGAVAKSNHYCLGYRDPIYKSIRELVMSYFHEYLNFDGEKTLRSYTEPLDLAKFDKTDWMTSDKDVWIIPETLVKMPHKKILTPALERSLRKADKFTRDVNNIVRQKKP
jgi:hypothetical protein